jgi:hypothetical protein
VRPLRAGRRQAGWLAPIRFVGSVTQSEECPWQYLAVLMIKYGCGVITEETYTLKQIDENFFSET